jgi:DNA-binding response OmpR family regulator
MQYSRILIVDDNTNVTKLLKITLEREGYQVYIFNNGIEAIENYNEISPDLIILDIILPDIDGFEICRIIRKNSMVPILVLSGLNSEVAMKECHNIGVNDYVTKPFENAVLQEKIRTLLNSTNDKSDNVLSVFNDGYIKINFLAHYVIVAGKEVHLTPIEFHILSELTLNAGVVIEYNELLKCVWGYEYEDQLNLLYRHINSLHKKIEPDPCKPRYIINVMKFGYRYDTHH